MYCIIVYCMIVSFIGSMDSSVYWGLYRSIFIGNFKSRFIGYIMDLFYYGCLLLFVIYYGIYYGIYYIMEL